MADKYVTQLVIEPPNEFTSEERARAWIEKLVEHLKSIKGAIPKDSHTEVHVYGPSKW